MNKKDSKLHVSHVSESDYKKIEEKLLKVSSLKSEDALGEIGAQRCGLTRVEVAKRQQAFGKNTISNEKSDSLLKRLLKAFINPFTVVLFILAFVSLFTDVILATDKNPRSVILICSMVPGRRVELRIEAL